MDGGPFVGDRAFSRDRLPSPGLGDQNQDDPETASRRIALPEERADVDGRAEAEDGLVGDEVLLSLALVYVDPALSEYNQATICPRRSPCSASSWMFARFLNA